MVKRSIDNRVKSLEHRVRANRPEMKTVTWTSAGTVTGASLNLLDITSLSQGTGVNERVGDRIKVWRIEIRGETSGRIQHYLVQKHGTTNPSFTSFGSGVYPFIDDSLNNNSFTEWRSAALYNLNVTQQGMIRFHQTFPRGLIPKYQGATNAPLDNGLLLVSFNGSTVDSTQNLSVRMWYTDN